METGGRSDGKERLNVGEQELGFHHPFLRKIDFYGAEIGRAHV